MYQLSFYCNFNFYLTIFLYLNLILEYKLPLKSFIISKTYKSKLI